METANLYLYLRTGPIDWEAVVNELGEEKKCAQNKIHTQHKASGWTPPKVHIWGQLAKQQINTKRGR